MTRWIWFLLALPWLIPAAAFAQATQHPEQKQAQTAGGDEAASIERFRPNEEQAWKLQEMSRNIADLEKRIARLYGDLKLLGYVDESGNTLLPFRMAKLTEFEKRESTLTQERIHIAWKGGAPDQITFRIRTATVRGMRTIVSIFRLNSVRSGNEVVEPDVDFMTIETLSSGRGNLVYYTLTRWDAPQITEKTRQYTDEGATYTMPFTQIRDPDRKIEVMTRILESYRDLERHLGYLVARSTSRQARDMDHYIPRY